MGSALEIAIRFFFDNFTYTFGRELYIQNFGGPIGARLTMCVARLVLQQWREDYSLLLREANIGELLSKICVDDNRAIVEKLKPGLRFVEEEKKFIFDEKWVEEDMKIEAGKRTIKEINKAMNSVNVDLKFTIETEEDFSNKRLPTLAFELWSEREGVRHSYYEKEMRSQLLTMKRSSQSENSKLAILTNELNRRFMMMDSKISTEEKIEKIDHFCKQLINSGYKWEQIREVTIYRRKG